MELDLLGSIELTTSAAIAIAVLATGFGNTIAGRIRTAAWLTLWFVAVVVLADTEALHYENGLGVSGLGVAVALPIATFIVLTLRSPALRRSLESIPLASLVGVNVIRAFGAVFVILFAEGRLPAPFAPVAGWGDILVGITAVPVALLAYKTGTEARSRILVWNTFGLLDLVAAVALGVTSSPGPLQLIHAEPGADLMTTLPWLLIPGFLVPLLASTHLAVFYRLRASGTASASSNEALAMGSSK